VASSKLNYYFGVIVTFSAPKWREGCGASAIREISTALPSQQTASPDFRLYDELIYEPES
jgi:hypothetical protein